MAAQEHIFRKNGRDIFFVHTLDTISENQHVGQITWSADERLQSRDVEQSRPEPVSLAQRVEPLEREPLPLPRSLAVPLNGLLSSLGNPEAGFISPAEIIERIRIALIGALAKIFDDFAIVLWQAICASLTRLTNCD